jgi:hypothetical protein
MEGLEFREDGSFVNPFSYTSGNGESVDEAVIVLGIDSPPAFVRGLHLWIHERYPDSRILDEGCEDGIRAIQSEGDHYTAISIEAPTGERSELVFNDSVLFAQSPEGRRTLPAASPDASYEEIVQRIHAGNLAVNFARLRTSFAESVSYDPDDAELRGYFGSMLDAVNESDWHAVVREASSFLKKCEASPFPHYFASQAYGFLGQEEPAAFHSAMADGLILSILSSKGGRSKKDAIEVLFILEEYEFLRLWGVQFERQELVRSRRRTFDVMHVSEIPGSGKVVMYFDVTRMLASRERRLGLGMRAT